MTAKYYQTDFLTKLAAKPQLRIAGLMSGTSADGVDVAIIDWSPEKLTIVAYDIFEYSDSLRKKILRLFNPDTARIEDICLLNFVLGEVFAESLIKLCKESNIPLSSIDLIGSHGQTIYHNPKGRRFEKKLVRSTLQIGEPCVIAQRTGITTVADFRPADIAAGGEGAPLVPFTDYLLFTDKRKNRVLQNIGGIANLTWLPADCRLKDIIAFDTGPGNMMIDCLASMLSKGMSKFDKDGRLASQGKVSNALLDELMRHKFLNKKPPKSTGREEFGIQFTKEFYTQAKKTCRPADILATVTAFTAKSIASAYSKFLPAKVDEAIICGGGSRNKTLFKMLEQYASPTKIIVMDDLGLNADIKEAVSFAILAGCTIKGTPNNLPAATGAKRPVVLGKIIPPQPL